MNNYYLACVVSRYSTQSTILLTKLFAFFLAISCLSGSLNARAQGNGNKPGEVLTEGLTTAALFDSVINFSGRELDTSLTAIRSMSSRPATLFGEPYEGEFSWPGVGVTLSDWEAASGKHRLDTHNLITWVNHMMSIDEDRAETFAQLFYLKTVTNYQSPTGTNLLLASLNPSQLARLKAATNIRRFYNVKTGHMGGRPQNYLAVAALIGAHAHKLGWESDKALITKLVRECADLIVANNGFLDDDRKGRGRFDRYSMEFNRFTWEAATLVNDQATLERLRPVIKQSFQVWWDMVSPITGYAAAYGRSLQNAWDDSWETAAFLAENPSLRPTSLANLISNFALCWNHYLANQYDSKRHLNRMLDPGRATYSYAGRDRIWSFTIHSFGKAISSINVIKKVAEQESVNLIPAKPNWNWVSRWVPIRTQDRQMGIWIVRQPGNYFVLPVVGSFRSSATSDYLPIPYGFPGLSIPVARQIPALVPFWTLGSGQVMTTAEGADSVSLSQDGKTLRLVTTRFSDLDGNLLDPSIKAVATWTWEDHELTYDIQLVSKESGVFKKFDFWVPSRLSLADLESGNLYDEQGHSLTVRADSDWQTRLILMGTGQGELSKGPFAPIPLIMQWTGANLPIAAGRPYHFHCVLKQE
jgi:hypothetical protein